MKQTTLIRLYCTACDNHSTIEEKNATFEQQSFPQIFGRGVYHGIPLGQIGRTIDAEGPFIRDYWHDWSPDLPSYQALAEVWSGTLCANFEGSVQYIIDSCPVILAKQAGSGSAKVAPEYCVKSYNSSRKEYYYGVKPHAIVIRRLGKPPVAEMLMVARASVLDLTAARELLLNSRLRHRGYLLADKAYRDAGWAEDLAREHGLRIVTPRKRLPRRHPSVWRRLFHGGQHTQAEHRVLLRLAEQPLPHPKRLPHPLANGLLFPIFSAVSAALLAFILYP